MALGFEPTPFWHESTPVTTKPGLLPVDVVLFFCLFFKWAIPGLFFFIFVSLTQYTVNKCSIKYYWWLDSNRGSLVSGATSLPLSNNHSTKKLYCLVHSEDEEKFYRRIDADSLCSTIGSIIRLIRVSRLSTVSLTFVSKKHLKADSH